MLRTAARKATGGNCDESQREVSMGICRYELSCWVISSRVCSTDMQLPIVAPTFSPTLCYFDEVLSQNGMNMIIGQEQLFPQVRLAPLLQLLSSDNAMA